MGCVVMGYEEGNVELCSAVLDVGAKSQLGILRRPVVPTYARALGYGDTQAPCTITTY